MRGSSFPLSGSDAERGLWASPGPPRAVSIRKRCAVASSTSCCGRPVATARAFALCRSIQIPALYVSGYLHTPDANASHAWIEVFIPGIGWRALDPTHGRQPDQNYVKLAVGRDYSDAAPTRGHYKGVTERTMEVTVRIEEA